MVCVEAMAAGKPVVCLDLAGPALQVTTDCGFKIAAPAPEQAITGLADAMTRLLASRELRERMGTAGRLRARDFSWRKRGEYFSKFYRSLNNGSTIVPDANRDRGHRPLQPEPLLGQLDSDRKP
jgi:glycosyltransferase involved in cell wall biosynthesis